MVVWGGCSGEDTEDPVLAGSQSRQARWQQPCATPVAAENCHARVIAPLLSAALAIPMNL